MGHFPFQWEEVGKIPGNGYIECTDDIRAVLREHPEGMSITSIASLCAMNRNTVAKYLGIMQSQGVVDVRQVGVAKIYFLTKRIPVSAIHRFCRQYIIVDHRLVAIEVSSSILLLLTRPAGECQSLPVCDLIPGLQGQADPTLLLKSALRGKEQTLWWRIRDRTFAVTLIPIVLESGRPAVALVLDAIAERVEDAEEELPLLRHRALFEDQRECIVRLSPDQRIQWVNHIYCRAVRQTRDDLHRQPFQQIVIEEDRGRWNQHLRSLTAEHPAATIECRCRIPDGTVRWQRWLVRGLYAASRKLLEYQLVGYDITACRLAQAELALSQENLKEVVQARVTELQERNRQLYQEIARCKQTEHRLRFTQFATDTAADMICGIDGSGRILYANQTLCESLGYTRKEVMTMNIQDIDTGFDRERMRQTWEAIRCDGHRLVESTALTKGGQLIQVEVTANHIRLNGEEYCCLYIRDITRQKRAGQDLRIKRDAIESSICSMIMEDLSGRVTYANRAMLEAWGYRTLDEVLRLSAADLYEDADMAFNAMTALLREGTWRGELPARKSNRTVFPVFLSANIIHDDRGNPTSIQVSCIDISEQKRAGDALHRSEERFKRIFKESPVGIAYYTRDGTLISANSACLAIFDTGSPAGIGGASLFTDPDLNLTVEQVRELQEGRSVTFAACVTRNYSQNPEQTGRARPGVPYIEGSITPLGRTAGPHDGYLLLVQDVTAREAVNAAQEGLRDRGVEIIQHLPNAAFAIDAGRRVIAWNRAMERMTGVTAEEIIGKGDYEYSLPFYRKRLPMLLDRVLMPDTFAEHRYVYCVHSEEGALTAEQTFPQPDGESMTLQGDAFAIRNSAGEVLGVIESIRDITAWRHTEDALKHERNFNTAFLETIDALIIAMDAEGRIAWCNDRCGELTGYSMNELIGREIHEVFRIDHRNGAEWSVFASLVPEDGPAVCTVPVTAISGEQRWIRWSGRALEQGRMGRYIICTGIDITGRIRRNEADPSSVARGSA